MTLRAIKTAPNKGLWLSYIRQRIRNNKNFLCFISGATGSGKSWSSLRVAEELDAQFNIDRVVFSGRELMALINSGELRKGSVIVFEEAGIEMSNRNWQSTTNKMLNYLLQTFRHKNFILIFNSPYMDFVDASTRKLFHAEMSTAGIDKEAETVTLKPLCIQYNGKLRKFYYKRLRVKSERGLVPVSKWVVGKPSPTLIEQYEEKKTRFTDELNEEIQTELNKIHNKTQRPLTHKQHEVLELLEQGHNQPTIASMLNVHVRTVQQRVSAIKKKGVTIRCNTS